MRTFWRVVVTACSLATFELAPLAAHARALAERNGPRGFACQAMAAVLKDGYKWSSPDWKPVQHPKITLAVSDPDAQPDCDWAGLGLSVDYSFGPDDSKSNEPGLGYVHCPTFRSKVGCGREQLIQAKGVSFSRPRVFDNTVSFESVTDCGWAMCGAGIEWTVTRKSDGSWVPNGQPGWIN